MKRKNACRMCKNHDVEADATHDHTRSTCPFINCDCSNCTSVREKREKMKKARKSAGRGRGGGAVQGEAVGGVAAAGGGAGAVLCECPVEDVDAAVALVEAARARETSPGK